MIKLEENMMTDEEAVNFAWNMYILYQNKHWLKMFNYLNHKYENEYNKRAIFKSSFVSKAERH